jgi:hypothetical protein
VSCPTGRSYVVERGVRLRPVPELGVCLVYTPARPSLHRLNATSWLIASLCDGRPYAEIVAAFRAALGSGRDPDLNEVTLREGIARLRALGILRAVPETATTTCEVGGEP